MKYYLTIRQYFAHHSSVKAKVQHLWQVINEQQHKHGVRPTTTTWPPCYDIVITDFSKCPAALHLSAELTFPGTSLLQYRRTKWWLDLLHSGCLNVSSSPPAVALRLHSVKRDFGDVIMQSLLGSVSKSAGFLLKCFLTAVVIQSRRIYTPGKKDILQYIWNSTHFVFHSPPCVPHGIGQSTCPKGFSGGMGVTGTTR